MIDKAINRPVLVLTTFLKRHWLVVLVILFLLWLLPPFIQACARFIVAWNNAWQSFKRNMTWLPEAAANVIDLIAEAPGKLFNWLGQNDNRFWWIPALLFPWLPRFAGMIAAWLILDRWKTQPVTISPIQQNTDQMPETGTDTTDLLNPLYNL